MKNKKYVKNLAIRCMCSIILFLLISVFVNYSNKNLLVFRKYAYDQNLKFTKITKLYNKYFGKVLKEVKETPVSDTKITYTDVSSYKDGAKLTIGGAVYPYKSGIVVFIGDKEEYGKTIIIQGMDGVDYWYSNVEDINVKLYDYVSSSTVIANAKDSVLYVVFMRDGKALNYEEYI